MPTIQEPPRALDFIFSEANGWRSRHTVRLLGNPAAIVYMPGTLLYPQGAELTNPLPTGLYLPITVAPPAGGGATPTPPYQLATAILMYPADVRDGDVEAAVIIRDAEVNDAFLLYYEQTAAELAFTDVQRAEINAGLRMNGIIVRAGVLKESLVAPPVAP
jgi:Bacteriophage lambda head decoration protein D